MTWEGALARVESALLPAAFDVGVALALAC
jgi:hypothetical protein